MDFGIEYDPADYWFTNEKVNLIKDLHDHLESYPFAGKVLSLASIIRTAEKFSVEDIIDPRDTRKLLCDFANLAAPLRTSGKTSFGLRP